MDDELVVTLDGLVMYGRPGLGPFVIVKDGLDGWDDGVTMRGEKNEQPQNHGYRSAPRYREGRSPTITGIIIATNSAEQHRAGRRLSGLLADGSAGRIQVARSHGTEWADATLESTSVDPRRGTYKSDFQIELWCADPRIYGNLHTYPIAAGATVNVSHRGNADATPKFIVAGSSAGGYTLNVAGRSYIVQIPLVTGQPHVIDYNDGRLRIGGVIIHGATSQSTLWKVPPGGQTAVTFTTVGGATGTATLELLDTYI